MSCDGLKEDAVAEKSVQSAHDDGVSTDGGKAPAQKPADRIIDVSGAAIVREGLVLCARRAMTKQLGGKWEFPGGKLERGETHEQALVREIHEELGCAIRVGREVCTTDNTYEFGTVRLVTFLCELEPGEEPHCLEHMELRWVAPVDMPSLDWAPADRDAVAAIVSQKAAL